MKILGLDLGSYFAGAAVMGWPGSGEPSLLALSEWSSGEKELGLRLESFWIWAKSLVQKYDLLPGDILAAEMPFVGIPKTALVLGQILGLVRQVSWWAEISLLLVSAKEAKLALTGYGGAYKQEVMGAAALQFPGVEWTEHTADALGIALAGAIKLRERALLAQARRQDGPGATIEGGEGYNEPDV